MNQIDPTYNNEGTNNVALSDFQTDKSGTSNEAVKANVVATRKSIKRSRAQSSYSKAAKSTSYHSPKPLKMTDPISVGDIEEITQNQTKTFPNEMRKNTTNKRWKTSLDQGTLQVLNNAQVIPNCEGQPNLISDPNNFPGNASGSILEKFPAISKSTLQLSLANTLKHGVVSPDGSLVKSPSITKCIQIKNNEVTSQYHYNAKEQPKNVTKYHPLDVDTLKPVNIKRAPKIATMSQPTTSKNQVNPLPQLSTSITLKTDPRLSVPEDNLVFNQTVKPVNIIRAPKIVMMSQPSKNLVNPVPQLSTSISLKTDPSLSELEDDLVLSRMFKTFNKFSAPKFAVVSQPTTSKHLVNSLTDIPLKLDPQINVLEDNIFYDLIFTKDEKIAEELKNGHSLLPNITHNLEQGRNTPQIPELESKHSTTDEERSVQVMPDKLDSRKYPRKREWESKGVQNKNSKANEFLNKKQFISEDKPAVDYLTAKQQQTQIEKIHHHQVQQEPEQKDDGRQSPKTEPYELICCLICSNQTFPNLREYQRHLALTHFQKDIVNKYVPENASGSPYSCVLCPVDFKLSFSYSSFLVIHLSTVHNCCLQFGGTDLSSQLLELNKTSS